MLSSEGITRRALCISLEKATKEKKEMGERRDGKIRLGVDLEIYSALHLSFDFFLINYVRRFELSGVKLFFFLLSGSMGELSASRERKIL